MVPYTYIDERQTPAAVQLATMQNLNLRRLFRLFAVLVAATILVIYFDALQIRFGKQQCDKAAAGTSDRNADSAEQVAHPYVPLITDITTNRLHYPTTRLKKEYFIYIAAMWSFVKDWVQTCRFNSNETIMCRFSRDKSFINKSDAVVFLARGSNFYESISELNSRQRSVNQLWVMVNRESPLNVNPKTLAALNGLANWTMTYMKSSDIRFGYYDVKPGTFRGGFDPTRNYLKGKTMTAAILISNCFPERMQWVYKMQEYIDVTVFGSCGTECGSNCYNELRKHKFYLSFENSYCQEYLTEKPFINGFENYLIPVVIAYINFNDPTFLPPNSAINALDFASVKELTDYMKKVAGNLNLYNEYFKWHSHYDIEDSFDGAYCELCRRAVGSRDQNIKVYTNLDDWFGRKRLCKEYPTPH